MNDEIQDDDEFIIGAPLKPRKSEYHVPDKEIYDPEDAIFQAERILDMIGKDNPAFEHFARALHELEKQVSLQNIIEEFGSIKVTEDGSFFLGEKDDKEQVFLEQIRAAHDIIKAIERNPLLVAYPQQGKTHCVLMVIDAIVRHFESCQVVYCINYASNSLRKQTRERVKKALGIDIEVAHHANYKSIQPEDTDVRLLLIDECHWCLGASNDEDTKPFHELMKRFGIAYGKPRNTWEDQRNFVVSLSATPYSQFIRTIINNGAFTPVPMPVSESYYSINHMLDRIKTSEPITEKIKNSDEFETTEVFDELMDEFRAACKKKGAGYAVIRSLGKRADAVIETLNSLDIPVIDFYHKNENTTEIDNQLKESAEQPTVVLIRATMRAGMTLTTTRNIRLWYELPTSRGDNVLQSGVGRCSGQPEKGTGHDRFSDTFSIYCNTEWIQPITDFYKKVYDEVYPDMIPSGTWNEVSWGAKYEMHVIDDFYDMPENVRAKGTSKISKNFKQDLAKAVLEATPRSHKTPTIIIDGPNENYMDSWDKLRAVYPTGKYAYFIERVNIETISTIRHDSMIHENVLDAESKQGKAR